MEAANQAFWALLRDALLSRGITGVPQRLDAAATMPDAIGPDMLFTQTCGYPLFRRYAGQAVMLGTPSYDFPGCAGAAHRAAFLVRAGDAAASLAGTRGRVFGCNSMHSNTGMNLPRLSLARIANGRPFFSQIVFTGGHVASMHALAAGEIDLCAVDCVTWGFVQRDMPALAAGLRILDWTEPSPCLPFITHAGLPAAELQSLRAALAAVFASPEAAGVLAALHLTGLTALQPGDYRILGEYEAEAARLGYPDLC